MEMRSQKRCTELTYNTVEHSLYADGEMIAETWHEEIPAADKVIIDEDYTKVIGEFEVVYNDNYEVLEIR